MLISFALIFILGIIFGKIFEKLGLPSLVGMILAGILIGENGFNLIDESVLNISSTLRQVALIIILTRAGLSLNISDLKKIGPSAMFMTFVPASFEIIGFAIVGTLILKLSVVEALLMGSVISAVSPAVVVPRMIKIMGKGYKKAPLQTVLAGSSVDDIFVIVLFTTFLSFLQGGDVSAKSFLFIPTSIICGIIIGVIFSKILYKATKNLKLEFKILLLLSASFILIYIEELTKHSFPVSGLIGIMTMGIMMLRQDKKVATEIGKVYNKMWSGAEILLFVLVGTIVDVKYAVASGVVGIIVIAISLVFRLVGVFVSLLPSKFSKKEKLFCAISYIPKATVQASIGAIPLTAGLDCGEIVFTMAVLSIIITAPLGAILMDKTYKRLLSKE